MSGADRIRASGESQRRVQRHHVVRGSAVGRAPEPCGDRRGSRGVRASQWWWVGMAGHVCLPAPIRACPSGCCSRQTVTLAAPQSAARPLGRVYPLVFADSRSDVGTPRLTDTRSPADMGMFAGAGRTGCVVSQLPNAPQTSDVGMSATHARPEHHSRHLANHRAPNLVCMSASTRARSGRVHPLNGSAAAPASRPRLACALQGAPGGCIQNSRSAPSRCIPDDFSRAPAGCIRPAFSSHPRGAPNGVKGASPLPPSLNDFTTTTKKETA